MIPDITRKEWQELITGKNPYKCSSFSLQMKINSLNHLLNAGHINMQHAVRELHELCAKYEKIYKNDLEKIFKITL